VLREKIGFMAIKDRWVAITSLLSAAIWIAFALKVAAQSSLSTTYTTADAWDCAGGASCPKPIGTVDGRNSVFVLRGSPTGPASVDVFQNGIRDRIGADYNLTGNTYQSLIFTSPPAAGDTIDIRYRENVRANVLPQ
jgi:hypothetical protein